MKTPEQIDDGGSVTADLICQRHVAEDLIAEEKVKSVGGLSLRDYFAAAALQGLIFHNNYGAVSDENIARGSYQYADAMLAARKGGA
jgi:hypothetical protein